MNEGISGTTHSPDAACTCSSMSKKWSRPAPANHCAVGLACCKTVENVAKTPSRKWLTSAKRNTPAAADTLRYLTRPKIAKRRRKKKKETRLETPHPQHINNRPAASNQLRLTYAVLAHVSRRNVCMYGTSTRVRRRKFWRFINRFTRT
jgi:hypothetical protein